MLKLNRIICGDCIDVMRDMPDNSIDSIVTDPPYNLTSIVKRFGKTSINDNNKTGKDCKEGKNPFARTARGFMGMAWDGTEIAFNVAMWQECLRVLKPGGHLLAFGGTRTYHRMACAIEDAGFEIRDCIQWIYGSGFPKSMDISKAIDKKQGITRPLSNIQRPIGGKDGVYEGQGGNWGETVKIPQSKKAIQWNGWGTALKPAHEPLVWATKPLKTVPNYGIIILDSLIGMILCQALTVWFVEKNLLSSLPGSNEGQSFVQWLVGKTGTQEKTEQSLGMDIFKSQETEKTFWNIVLLWNSILEENCIRQNTSIISMETNKTIDWKILKSLLLVVIYQSITQAKRLEVNGLEYFVSNVEKNSQEGKRNWTDILKVTAPENVIMPLLKNVQAELVNFAENNLTTKELRDYIAHNLAIINQDVKPAHEPIVVARKPLSEKTVADNVLKWGTGGINIDGCRVETNGETPKGSGKGSKNSIFGQVANSKGNDGNVTPELGRFPANLILDEEAGQLLDEQSGISISRAGGYGGKDPGMWKGKKQIERGGHNDKGGASRFFYCAKASKKERGEGNTHPTVKPLALMRYLVRLVTPPDGTVLDPFAGSGSTLVASMLEGFNFVGIEREQKYVDIANQRIAEHSQQLAIFSCNILRKE